MAVDNKLSGCPHCGKGEASEPNGPDGWTLRAIGPHLKSGFMIACACGIMTRICPTLGHLRVVWNSRRNKPWIEPEITVIHPGPRGAEPGTTNEILIKDQPF